MVRYLHSKGSRCPPHRLIQALLDMEQRRSILHSESINKEDHLNVDLIVRAPASADDPDYRDMCMASTLVQLGLLAIQHFDYFHCEEGQRRVPFLINICNPLMIRTSHAFFAWLIRVGINVNIHDTDTGGGSAIRSPSPSLCFITYYDVVLSIAGTHHINRAVRVAHSRCVYSFEIIAPICKIFQ